MMENGAWKRKCLTAVVIIFNGVIFSHSSPAKDVGPKAGATVTFSHSALRHIGDRSNYSFDEVTENGRMSKRMKNWHRLVRELKSVIIKLRNVVDKYDWKEEELKLLYPGVADCGRGNCGKFSYLLPKNQKLEHINCKKFEKLNVLRKWTMRLLSFFQKRVPNFDRSFQLLIYFEKLPEFRKQDLSNGSRLQILNELHTDLKTLSLEIREVVNVMSNKRLNFPPSTLEMEDPRSQTDLLLYEWRIIQQSKEFLVKWQKQMDKVFRCWQNWKAEKFKRSFKKEKKQRLRARPRKRPRINL